MIKALGTMLVFLWTLILLVYIANAQEFVPGEVIVKFKADTTPQEQDMVKKLYGLKDKSKHEAIGSLNFAIPPGKDPKKLAEEISHDPAVEYAEPNYIAPLPGVDEERHER